MNPINLATPAEPKIWKKNTQQLKHPKKYFKTDLQIYECANCSNQDFQMFSSEAESNLHPAWAALCSCDCLGRTMLPPQQEGTSLWKRDINLHGEHISNLQATESPRCLLKADIK